MSEQISGGVKHPSEMSKEELLSLVWNMSEMALDLSQHLECTEMLRVQYKKDAYKRAAKMAAEIVYAWEYQHPKGNCEVAMFDGNGLTVERGELMDILESPPPERSRDKELDYGDFEQMFDLIDGAVESGALIERAGNALRYLRELSEGKFGKEHVDVKVKTLNKAIYNFEMVHEVMSAAKALVDLMRKQTP